ncbi:hypothetical protein ACPPVU_18440 [Mucilaginibacter sp. McL0603]|uniref:hypothetical protein n=1 Tax=Mucilaginibacter sp. McL0603 TaxID=3415670 RepID=UPI003CF8D195
MLTENKIVDNLSNYLAKNGYIIRNSCTTTQRGIDLIAENKNEILYIEAKGETSSKEGSNRFGLTFNQNQVKTHVSRAILASMIVLQDKPDGPKTKVALPYLIIQDIEL